MNLHDDAALAAEIGLEWLSPEIATEWTGLWRSAWASAPWDPGFVERGRDALGRMRIVARLPARARRTSGAGCPLVVVEEDGHGLALLPGVGFPPSGLPRFAPTADGLRQALADYARGSAPVPSLPRTLRIVKSLDLDDVGPILATAEHTEPWMDDGWWGPPTTTTRTPTSPRRPRCGRGASSGSSGTRSGSGCSRCATRPSRAIAPPSRGCPTRPGSRPTCRWTSSPRSSAAR